MLFRGRLFRGRRKRVDSGSGVRYSVCFRHPRKKTTGLFPVDLIALLGRGPSPNQDDAAKVC